jgi:hypothetical protein
MNSNNLTPKQFITAVRDATLLVCQVILHSSLSAERRYEERFVRAVFRDLSHQVELDHPIPFFPPHAKLPDLFTPITHYPFLRYPTSEDFLLVNTIGTIRNFTPREVGIYPPRNIYPFFLSR